jgi:hypothetical protein
MKDMRREQHCRCGGTVRKAYVADIIVDIAKDMQAWRPMVHASWSLLICVDGRATNGRRVDGRQRVTARPNWREDVISSIHVEKSQPQRQQIMFVLR